MPAYSPGDLVKVEFKDDRTGDSEWMWVKVGCADDEKRLIFGRLDNEPIAVFRDKLYLGKELAVSYDLVRDVWKETSAIQ
jgi:hypothetical protein